EFLDLLPCRIAQLFSPTEVGGIRLDQAGIELMLADELAQPVADPGTAVPIAVAIDGLRRELLRLPRRRNSLGRRSDFLDRADADAIGFAQGTINGSCFSHPQFSTLYQSGYIRWFRVAITHEALAGFRFEY